MATSLEDLELLQNAETICDDIWEHVQSWSILATDTVGKQMSRSADSIGANIAESYGRYHFGEKIQFLYYARGSIYETKYWLRRAKARNLIAADQAESCSTKLQGIAKGINVLIKTTRNQRRKIK